MTREEATWILSSMISDFGKLGVAKEMAIQALQEQIVWHPYPKEKPTEESEMYMVTTDCGEVENRWWYYTFWVRATSKVVAWAELPKPYEEGAEE